MHLKSLEVVGFKSFLNKTKIKFEPGVTAVVGPNGCGKSNVVDAIKWVLGDQSAKSMRSSSMGDVIFNGTDKQDPLNMAEVSITLSNEDRSLPLDYDEVTVSRRLFRSGESEYILNKTPVRLKDIKDLLMGTGIGTSSYSVVEQGRMDMILSSKPEDRRHIFEEASGITKYRTQKREAMNKLARTQDNLTRINDIVREVARQINSIERQARKAERYKARFEELKDLDVKLSYAKYSGLGSDDSKAEEEHNKLQSYIRDLQEKVEEYSETLSNNREEFNAVIDDLQVSQGELASISSELDKDKHIIQMNTERIQELQKTVERLDWEIEETQERKDALASRLEALEARFLEVSDRCKAKSDELNAQEDEVRKITEGLDLHRHEVQVNKTKTLDIASEETQMRNSIIKMEADIQNMQAREKRLEKEKRGVISESERVSEEMKAMDSKVRDVESLLEDKRNEARKFAGELGVKQQELTSLINERREKEIRLNEVRPRREFLEKLVNEREGINGSVKEILKHVEDADPRFKGVHGILSEVIGVKEEFSESIESVLGDVSQALVVDNRSVAGKVVEFLHGNSMGSVTFVMLEELEDPSSDNIPPGLKDVTQIIKSEGPYLRALKSLLANTMVADSFEAAQSAIDSSHDPSLRVVSERGEIFRKGVKRSRNYSDKEVVSLFGRKEKAKELRQEEDAILRQVEGINAAIKDMEQWLNDSQKTKERLEADLRDKEIEFANTSSRSAVIREKLKALTDEVAVLDTDIEEERTSRLQLTDERALLEVRVQQLAEESVKMKSSIDESQRFIQESTHKRDIALYKISDIRAELSGLKKEEENLADNLRREKDVFSRIDSEVLDKRTRITESGERITTLQQEIEDLTERMRELAAEEEIKKSTIDEKQRQKDRLSGDIHLQEEQLKLKERELEELRNKSRDVDIQQKELEYKKAALCEKVLEAYKVDITTAQIEIPEDMNWAEVGERVQELKEQLDKMGDVSLGAVEEHKELQERHEFLAAQAEDLTKAREELMSAIARINRTTRKMFIETFEAIGKEFSTYFKMLFNGGKAELVLEDESNILECGIDIIVRPPGKKLHNIMQLSGGEKAMTAIALIFAIFKVNPSPFCVLDEIDAPLDEANIVRFCKVLQEFLKLSQFIVVTHNRMTIQLADVLYGITMQEKGVSKVVSVKFSEEDGTEEVSQTVEVGA